MLMFGSARLYDEDVHLEQTNRPTPPLPHVLYYVLTHAVLIRHAWPVRSSPRISAIYQVQLLMLIPEVLL